MSELLPCPFCGNEGELCTYYGGGEHNETVHTVMCNNEDCPMNVLTPDYLTEAEAIAAWNTRAERTCKVAACYSPSDFDSEDEWYFAFSCGCELYWDEAIPPNYCPNCGARVVTCRNTSDSNYFRCSVCRKKTYRGEEMFKYCPNCGARVEVG